MATILASQGLAGMIGYDVPIIIESMIPPEEIGQEIESVCKALKQTARERPPSAYEDWGELA
jgi:hypothetical protein